MFKIIEWNINHRLGYSQTNMPMWVADIIIKEDADIFILTECSNRVKNWPVVKSKAFSSKKYIVFESQNDQGGNNNVVIAVKKEKFNVLYAKSFFSCNHNIPDHLEVKCKCKETGKEFVVVGVRIHAFKITDIEKETEFQIVLDGVKNEETVIIGGDFNNNRRGYNKLGCWHLTRIDEIILNEFVRKTPSGSSIYKDVNECDYLCFAEDHFFIKGINNFILYSYDRSFTDNDRGIYKWYNDFQTKLEENKYDNIPDPYPDHAILKAEFHL